MSNTTMEELIKEIKELKQQIQVMASEIAAIRMSTNHLAFIGTASQWPMSPPYYPHLVTWAGTPITISNPTTGETVTVLSTNGCIPAGPSMKIGD